MPRSKKAGGGQPPPNQDPSSADAHEAAENEGMAHVGADELAGSPDIFARKNDTATEPGPASASEPQAVVETAEATPETPPAAPDPISTMEAPPPPFMPAPPAMATTHAPPARRSGSGIALGVVFVVIGVFYLLVQVLGIDLSSFGWPLFVIIPGLTLLIVGIISLGTGAAIPGGILTTVGLVLAYQNSTGNWASWAYAWALVAPGGVGVGLFLQGMRDRNQGLIKQGRSLIVIAFLIFMIGFVFFESILHLTGTDYGLFGKVALPGLLVVIGVALLVRSLQRSRSA